MIKGSMFSQVMPVKLPNSQKVIAGRLSNGSATYFNKEVNEPKNEPTRIPIKVKMSKGLVLYNRLPKKDKNTAKINNKGLYNAHSTGRIQG